MRMTQAEWGLILPHRFYRNRELRSTVLTSGYGYRDLSGRLPLHGRWLALEHWHYDRLEPALPPIRFDKRS